jgi:transcription antitermination factor NusG
LEIETYCPMMKTFKKYLRPGQRQIEPLFTGYVFAILRHPSDPFRLRQVRGLNRVVCFDGRPARLDPQVIAEFRAEETAAGYILIRPKKWNRHEGWVDIVDGAFAGHRALFVKYLERHERVQVLLEILRRQTPVELPLTSVAPAGRVTAEVTPDLARRRPNLALAEDAAYAAVPRAGASV